MEKHYTMTPPFMGLLKPIPNSKEYVANALFSELRKVYPGIFIEVGGDLIKDAKKEYDDANVVFALFRKVSPAEIHRMPRALWVIEMPTIEVMAYLQTQGVNIYDTFHVTYRYIGNDEQYSFITVRADANGR